MSFLATVWGWLRKVPAELWAIVVAVVAVLVAGHARRAARRARQVARAERRWVEAEAEAQAAEDAATEAATKARGDIERRRAARLRELAEQRMEEAAKVERLRELDDEQLRARLVAAADRRRKRRGQR